MIEQIKKVLVLYSGGTIGMEKNDDGVYVPVPHKFFEELKSISELHDPKTAKKYFPDLKDNQLVLPKLKENIVLYEVKEYDPLLDSSNMTPKEWIKIAKDVEGNYDNFDGFVILHGTDTLAYTSSALSFMFDGLEKPVIITGSQISVYETRTDALNNIMSSLVFAGCYNVPEVCVLFANKVLRGNRATKIRSSRFDSYDSPNYDPLAWTEVEIIINTNHVLRHSATSFSVNTNLNPNVAVLTFSPTITSSVIENFLQQSLSGVILQTYGAGNIPSNQTDIVDVLKSAVDRGILIVNISVCLQGSVSPIYETGKVLEDIGVVAGYDMTMEAAVTKLCVVLGYSNLTYDDKVTLMKESIRGELTPPSYKYL